MEMVFGTIDLSEKSSGYKVHPLHARNRNNNKDADRRIRTDEFAAPTKA